MTVAQKSLLEFLRTYAKRLAEEALKLGEDMVEFYTARAEVHAKQGKVARIEMLLGINKENFEANEKELRRALRELVAPVIKAIQLPAFSYLKAIIGREHESNAPERLGGNSSRGWRFSVFFACAGGANLTQRMSDSAISIPPEREREGRA
ncbi:MAG: hypothetical protein WAS73_06605, partial [Defluviicoccus sp.]